MDSQNFYKRTANSIAAYLWQELALKPNRHYGFQAAVSGPRVLTLTLVINPRYAQKIIRLSQSLSMAAGLDRDQTMRIGRGPGGSLILEVPKPRDLWYHVPITALPRRRGLKTTVGLDAGHRPTWLDFADPTSAHCLVAGATGTGKTNAQRLLIYDLALQNEPAELNLLLIDARKRGAAWRPFARLPHLIHPVIVDDRQAARALSWAVAEIDRRAAAGCTTPQVFIGIDEVQTLLEREDLVRLIADLAAIGREFGLHLIAATQNPTAAALGDVSIKRNMIRLVGRVDSPDAARVATGQAGSGAETLTGAGDMLLVLPGLTRRLTTALLTPQDTDRLPRVEAVPCLDLAPYDDPEHVAEVAPSHTGRLPDPIEAEHLAFALIHPEASQREMHRQFSIGFPKIKRVQAYAQDLTAVLAQQGYTIQVAEGLPRPTGLERSRNGATQRKEPLALVS